MIANCIFGVIVAHHAATCCALARDARTCMQEIGVPDEHIAPVGEENALFKALLRYNFFDFILVMTIAVAANSKSAISRVVVFG